MNMNKKLFISLGTVVLIVIVAIVFYSSQNKATPVGTEVPKVKIGHLDPQIYRQGKYGKNKC